MIWLILALVLAIDSASLSAGMGMLATCRIACWAVLYFSSRICKAHAICLSLPLRDGQPRSLALLSLSAAAALFA